MRIAQIIAPTASAYDRKSQIIDALGLAAAHEVVQTTFETLPGVRADVIHVYGAPPQRPRIETPYVASRDVPRRRFQLRKPVAPRAVVTPFNVPEAVADEYFQPSPAVVSGTARQVHTIGSFVRPSLRNVVELTLGRIQRFRDDVSWKLFDAPPSPADLQTVDAWVDPAAEDDDYDGFVAEALVCGKPVVASRTPLNNSRLEKSRTGFLVPRADPNELTHAILTALFKLEVAGLKIEAARQTAGKFRSRQRIRALEKLYESLVR